MLPSEYLIDVYSEQFTKDILTEVKARISADVSAATEYAMRKGLIKDIGRYKEIADMMRKNEKDEKLWI